MKKSVDLKMLKDYVCILISTMEKELVKKQQT